MYYVCRTCRWENVTYIYMSTVCGYPERKRRQFHLRKIRNEESAKHGKAKELIAREGKNPRGRCSPNFLITTALSQISSYFTFYHKLTSTTTTQPPSEKRIHPYIKVFCVFPYQTIPSLCKHLAQYKPLHWWLIFLILVNTRNISALEITNVCPSVVFLIQNYAFQFIGEANNYAMQLKFKVGGLT